MMPTDASRPRSLPYARGWIALYGTALLIWMSLEDTGVVMPVIFGGTGALLILLAQAGRFTFFATARHRVVSLFVALLGAGLGAGTALIAAALMLIKNGWHSHVLPDFPFGLILDTLARAPFWAVAGTLFALGWQWARWAFEDNRRE